MERVYAYEAYKRGLYEYHSRSARERTLLEKKECTSKQSPRNIHFGDSSSSRPSGPSTVASRNEDLTKWKQEGSVASGSRKSDNMP